jgi:hypothetical protein
MIRAAAEWRQVLHVMRTPPVVPDPYRCAGTVVSVSTKDYASKFSIFPFCTKKIGFYMSLVYCYCYNSVVAG